MTRAPTPTAAPRPGAPSGTSRLARGGSPAGKGRAVRGGLQQREGPLGGGQRRLSLVRGSPTRRAGATARRRVRSVRAAWTRSALTEARRCQALSKPSGAAHAAVQENAPSAGTARKGSESGPGPPRSGVRRPRPGRSEPAGRCVPSARGRGRRPRGSRRARPLGTEGSGEQPPKMRTRWAAHGSSHREAEAGGVADAHPGSGHGFVLPFRGVPGIEFVPDAGPSEQMLTEDPPAHESEYRAQLQSRVGCKAECGSQGPAQETSDLTPEGQAPGTTGTSGQREGAAGLRREEPGRVRAEGRG